MTIGLHAQWSDNFEDGDLTQGTAWQGDVNDFIVNGANQLQLNAPQAGVSQLYTVVDIPDSTVWSFWMNLDFSPSTSNALQLVLQADQADLSLANGYLLEIGETGSQDAIRLIRLDAGNSVLLGTGTAGAVGGSGALCRLRITRTSIGQWTLAVDYSGGANLQADLVVQDDTYSGMAGAIFGPRCTYTSTRTDKFFFDDFRIEALLPDLTPPQYTGVEVVDQQEIRVLFSEPLREAEASDAARYNLSPDLGQPAMAEWSDQTPSQVNLIWTNPMVTLTTYTLEAYGLADTAGNTVDTLRIDFPYLFAREPVEGEILISEIMADPTPVVAQPEAEYIELYNPTSEVLDIGGLGFTTSTSQTTLPDHLMLPGSYLVLTRTGDADLFVGIPDVLGVPGFPSLTNDGAQLRILTAAGEIIDEVNYLDDWHATTVKRDGGWSLELIDPGRRCDREGNWTSSTDPTGGTPGRTNSVNQSNPDSQGPRLLRVWPASDTRLVLDFNKRVDGDPQLSWIILDPVVPIDQITRLASGFQVQVDLAIPLQTGVIYQVTSTMDFLDCLGNSGSAASSRPVGLPERPEPGDLLVNELLYDPPTSGVDFLEVVNVSDKIISMEHILVGNIQPGKEEVRPVDQQALCFPGDHLVLTADPQFVLSSWPSAEPGLILQTVVPAWANDSGNVTMYFQDGPDLVLLDGFSYQASMQNPLLDDPEGVTLERVSPVQAAGIASNWQSASEDSGFGTPTRQNSQYRDLVLDPSEGFSLESGVFSPDGDGWQDALLIRYRLDESGHILNLRVFDREGRFVKEIADTEYLGREGLLAWQGDQEGGQPAGPGVYVLWFERYRLDGQVDHFKMTAVLALPLD